MPEWDALEYVYTTWPVSYRSLHLHAEPPTTQSQVTFSALSSTTGSLLAHSTDNWTIALLHKELVLFYSTLIMAGPQTRNPLPTTLAHLSVAKCLPSVKTPEGCFSISHIRSGLKDVFKKGEKHIKLPPRSRSHFSSLNLICIHLFKKKKVVLTVLISQNCQEDQMRSCVWKYLATDYPELNSNNYYAHITMISLPTFFSPW